MIKANDLRIGNFVRLSDFRICKVETVNVCAVKLSNVDNSFFFESFNENDIYPIDVSDELLLKCKFNYKQLGLNNLAVSRSLFSNDFHFIIGNYYKKINYLHELQNLSNVLTGEELEVNL